MGKKNIEKSVTEVRKPAKTWKYTLNNYKEKDIEFFKKLDCTRHRCSKEIGEKCKTPHLQGMITFIRAYRMTALKKLHNDVHWEIAYCADFNYETKIDSEWLIDVNHGKQGKRSDLDDVVDKIKKGGTLKDIAEEFPKTFIMANKGIERLIQMKCKPRDWEMEVHIRWGKPGTGKTRYVWDTYGVDNVYPKMKNKWWDHYLGQKTVLIDDFDPEHAHEMAFDHWLTLLDRYPMIVEYKGGSCQFCSKKIYITSNFDPKTWFMNRGNRDAFFRRVNSITEVTL